MSVKKELEKYWTSLIKDKQTKSVEYSEENSSKTTEDKNSNKGSDNKLLIGLIFAFLIVLVGVVFYLYYRKKKIN